jgi:hypothetical protein
LSNLGGFVAAEKSHMTVVTVHKYPFFVCTATEVPPTPPDLIGDKATTGFAASYAQPIRDAKAAGLQFRMAETNSVACGGVAGVSDAFTASLWSADVMFQLAALGATGMNFHVAGKYAPFLFDKQGHVAVHGLYHGMLFFSRATAAGGRLLPVQVTSGARVRAWATLGTDGAVRVALLNEDLAAGGQVSIKLASPRGAAQLLRLSGPALGATTGIRLGGLSFDGTTDGKPTSAPSSETVALDATGGYQVTLPVTSGAVLVAR